MPVVIRNYTDADNDDCLDAFKSNIPAYFLQKELNDFERWLAVDIKSEHQSNEVWQYYVLELDHRVIGCGGFVIELNKKEARMTWGLIHRTAHRRGFGMQLLRCRIDEIHRIEPHCKILLDTTQHSAPFFEKIGFKTLKIINDGYGPGMHRYDMVFEPVAT